MCNNVNFLSIWLAAHLVQGMRYAKKGWSVYFAFQNITKKRVLPSQFICHSLPSNIGPGTNVVTEWRTNSIERVNANNKNFGRRKRYFGCGTSLDWYLLVEYTETIWKGAPTPIFFLNVLYSFPEKWKSQTPASQFATLQDLHEDLTSKARW